MVDYLHSIFLRFPNAPSPPVMFLKTDMNSGINFLAIGPAGCLVDQQYGSVWAWSGNANPSPNPLGRWAPTAKSLLIETLDDGSASFTNLMYWLDWGEFPKTTIFDRWKEHLSDRQNEKAWKWTIVGGFAFGVPASLCKALDHFVYHSCTVPMGNEDIHTNPKFGFFKAGMHIFSH